MNAPDNEGPLHDSTSEVLSYAPQQRGRRWPRRLRLVICIAAAAVALLMIVSQGLKCSQWGEFCVNCGAHSHVHHLSWHGMGGNYARRTQEGPVSTWIQLCERHACTHKWEPTSGEAGNGFPSGARFQCRALTRDVGVRQLEGFSSPCVEKVLQSRLDADPQFLAKFRKEVLAEDRGEEPTLYGDLLDSLMVCHNDEE